MVVHQFINPYRFANTFVIEAAGNGVIIVDFGNYDLSEFSSWLKDNNKVVLAVFLTHEHSDHCNGLQKLHDKFPFILYCSEKCAANIKNSKQNFSYYIDEMETFELHLPATILKDGDNITLAGIEFQVIETPGHSPGGMCIFTNDAVFTGDTILNNIKTPLTFPHSSRKDYAASLKKMEQLLKPGQMLYPGHDSPFVYRGEGSIII